MPKSTTGKIHITKGKDKQFYAHYVARNGRTRLDFGEGYKKKHSLKKSIESIRIEFSLAPIVDDTVPVVKAKKGK